MQFNTSDTNNQFRDNSNKTHKYVSNETCNIQCFTIWSCFVVSCVCMCVMAGAAAFIDFPINFAHCPHQIALNSRFVQRFRGFIDRVCLVGTGFCSHCIADFCFWFDSLSLHILSLARLNCDSGHVFSKIIYNLQCYASMVEYLMRVPSKRKAERDKKEWIVDAANRWSIFEMVVNTKQLFQQRWCFTSMRLEQANVFPGIMLQIRDIAHSPSHSHHFKSTFNSTNVSA